MSNYKPTFGDTLRNKRLAKKLTIRDVEKKTGISDSMYSNYEHNRMLTGMSVDHAKKLSKLFRWDLRNMISEILDPSDHRPLTPKKE